MKAIAITGLLVPLALTLAGCADPKNAEYEAKLAQATQAADRALAAQAAAEKAADRAEAARMAVPTVPNGPGELNPDNDPPPTDPEPDIPNQQH